MCLNYLLFYRKNFMDFYTVMLSLACKFILAIKLQILIKIMKMKMRAKENM